MYEDAKVRVEDGRAAHRSRHHRRRGGRVSRPYPDDLKPIADFGTWLADRIREEMAAGHVLDDHLVSIAFPPNRVALTFKSIKSHGCHYRVANEDGTNKHVSYDCGIAGLFKQGCRSNIRDKEVVEVQLAYVGTLVEILQVSYGSTNVILFKGRWVRPDCGDTPTMKQDEYGFWLADFSRMQPPNVQPYVFPSQVQQVFVSDDPWEAGWKVIMNAEPRSVRVADEMEDMRLVQSTNKYGVDAHLHNDEPEMINVAQEDFQVFADEEVPIFAFNVVASGTEGKGSSSEPNDSASDHSCDGGEDGRHW